MVSVDRPDSDTKAADYITDVTSSECCWKLPGAETDCQVDLRSVWQSVRRVTDGPAPSCPLIGIIQLCCSALCPVELLVSPLSPARPDAAAFLPSCESAPSGFMGLVETRVYSPLRTQSASLTEEKSSWSFLVPLVSFGMGNCLEWPLRTVGQSAFLLSHVCHISARSCAAAFLPLLTLTIAATPQH